MIITCPSCHARYKVSDELITGKGKRVKCRKCEAVFRAYLDKDAVLEGRSQPAPAPSTTTDASTPGESTPGASTPGASTPGGVKVSVGVPSTMRQSEPSPQATVKVENFKLREFLTQNPASGNSASAPASGTPKPENTDDTQNLATRLTSPATVQIDRAKIDAFLQNNPKDEPPDLGTRKFDRGQLNEVLAREAAAGDDQFSFDTTPTPAEDSGETIRVNPDQFGAFIKDLGQERERGPAFSDADPSGDDQSDQMHAGTGLGAFDRDFAGSWDDELPETKFGESGDDDSDPSSFSFDDPGFGGGGEGAGSSPSPSFDEAPSSGFGHLDIDEEPSEFSFDPPEDRPGFDEGDEGDVDFGSQPAANASPVDFDDSAQADESGAESSHFGEDDEDRDAARFSSFDFNENEASAPSSVRAEISEDPVISRPEQDETQAPTQLYKARVEDIEYPNLTLDTINRWIREGRLLETDLVAPNGTDRYTPTSEIPEIEAIFVKYFGKSGNDGKPAEQKQKAGLLARLLSPFKKN